MRYRNPVIPGFHPDPSVCRVGEDYYLVTSSFEYFPGVPVFHSRDLVNWRQIGHCLTRQSQLPLEKARYSAGIYAPSIRYHNGRFYMVTTNVSIRKHLVVSTDDPSSEWSEPIWVRADGIDPSLLFDDDGKVYLTSQGTDGIIQTIIDIDTGDYLSDTCVIWSGTGGQSPEGPHLYKINGKYYLMIAEGGTEYGHMETIARSDSPWGPFESCPHNPILSHRSCSSPIQCTGHCDLVQDHLGDWWTVFLAVRPVGYPPCYHLGRETYLAPVLWAQDGWPVVGGNGRVALEMEADCLPPHPWPVPSVRDDFDKPNPAMCWNFLRNPREGDWSLVENPGFLRLHGSPVTLNEEDSPAFVGRRQEHFDCEATVSLEFAPAAENEEAGLTVYMNPRHHYEIAVSLDSQGHRAVFVRRRIGNLQAVVASVPITGDKVLLRIEAEPSTYHFVCSQDGEKWQHLAEGETRYVSTEVAGGFTGVYLGMYATGSGRSCSAPADFDWFDYKY